MGSTTLPLEVPFQVSFMGSTRVPLSVPLGIPFRPPLWDLLGLL